MTTTAQRFRGLAAGQAGDLQRQPQLVGRPTVAGEYPPAGVAVEAEEGGQVLPPHLAGVAGQLRELGVGQHSGGHGRPRPESCFAGVGYDAGTPRHVAAVNMPFAAMVVECWATDAAQGKPLDARICCHESPAFEMGEVTRLPHRPPTLGASVDGFLDGVELAVTTRRVYTASFTSLIGGFGADTPLGDINAATVQDWFRRRYDGVAPATWNRELATLRSATRWWQEQGWLAEDPTRGLLRRREIPGLDHPTGRDPVATRRRTTGEDAVAAAV